MQELYRNYTGTIQKSLTGFVEMGPAKWSGEADEGGPAKWSGEADEGGPAKWSGEADEGGAGGVQIPLCLTPSTCSSYFLKCIKIGKIETRQPVDVI